MYTAYAAYYILQWEKTSRSINGILNSGANNIQDFYLCQQCAKFYYAWNMYMQMYP